MTRPIPHRRHLLGAVAATAALAAVLPSAAFAQAWPTARPITLLVGYPPGGSVDLVARLVAEPLARRLGTTIVVENSAGAGGTIAAQKAVNAAPNGYTLLLGSGSEVSIARLFNPAVKYDGQTDLTHVGLIGITPMVFVASAKTDVKTMDEAVAKSKKEPGLLNFASSGVGTPLHVAGELINQKAGTTFNHVPYRGASQMVQDVLGGNIDYGVFVLSSALPHIQSGKMVALGVTTPGRSRAAPNVPALAESPALKGYDMNVWFGLFGPARLPPEMTARLNKELDAVIRDETVWPKLAAAGVSNDGGTPAQLTAFIKAETLRVKSVLGPAGVAPAATAKAP